MNYQAERTEMADYLGVAAKEINALTDQEFASLESTDTRWTDDAEELAEYNKYDDEPVTPAEAAKYAFYAMFEQIMEQR